MTYEGIYRKTGGMGQTKLITQYFERGLDFDLQDRDKFNDIAAITSCMKNYFRSLPVPLMTHDLHEDFVAAAGASYPLYWQSVPSLSATDRLPCAHRAARRRRTTASGRASPVQASARSLPHGSPALPAPEPVRLLIPLLPLARLLTSTSVSSVVSSHSLPRTR